MLNSRRGFAVETESISRVLLDDRIGSLKFKSRHYEDCLRVYSSEPIIPAILVEGGPDVSRYGS